MSTEVRVPTLGESVTEATVATWFKQPGDAVSVDEMLCELETDKVTVEVPSPAAGTLSEIVAGEGETVGVDALLASIAEAGEGAAGGSGSRGSESGGATSKQGAQPDSAPAQQEAGEDETAEAGSAGGPDDTGGESVDVMVPTLGESVSEATVGTWFKKVGDEVAQDEMLCELETDKVSVEVPAPAAGTLTEIVADEGTTVDAKAKLAVLTKGAAAGGGGGGAQGHAGSGGQEGGTTEKEKAASAAEPAESGTDSYTAQPGGAGSGNGHDAEHAPSAKKMMAERGVDPAEVKGSGKGGRIMKEDVLRALNRPQEKPEAKQAPRAPVPAEDAGREERVKMTRLRQTIARRLKEAQNTAAMLTTYNEVDMTEVMALRSEYKEMFEKKHGVRLGFMSFFTKACCHALKEVPEVNAEIDGTEIVYKNFVHIGIATGTPTGLVVPIIRDADSLGFAEIEKAIAEKGKRARDGKLSMSEMQGGTFTISNGGVYGSLMSSPILNPPQSGILGMHKIQDRPMVIGGEIKIRPMMYLALSYDHRIVDGKGAVTFLVRVKEALEDPRRMLMDL